MNLHLQKSFALLLFYVIIASSQVFAQKVYVPDNAFETILIAKGYDNALDDSVLLNNINTVKILDIPANNISDLTGIEWFTALEDLKCTGNKGLRSFKLNNGFFSKLININLSNNGLTSIEIPNSLQIANLNLSRNVLTTIDLSKFTALKTINLSYNQLTEVSFTKNTLLQTVDVSHNSISNTFAPYTLTSLKTLICSFNKILTVAFPMSVEYLDCSNNSISVFSTDNFLQPTADTSLRHLDISYNKLTNFDFGKGITKYLTNIYVQNNLLTSASVAPSLYNRIIFFDARNNSGLNCIATPTPFTMNNLKTSGKVFIDAAATFSATCARTYIPDDAFEQFLLDVSIDSDGMLNDYVFTADLGAFGTFDVPKNKIKDLTGIKGFPNLTTIYLNNDTTLTNIDLSGITTLKTVLINNTRLTSLNLSGAKNVSNLSVQESKLTNINLDGVASLKSLNLRTNQLSDINLTGLDSITSLFVSGNKLQSLNISNLSLSSFSSTDNPKLFCITVADSSVAAAKFANSGWVKDKQTSFGKVCLPEVYVPISDPVFEQFLVSNQYDDEVDGQVRQKKIATITYLGMSGLGLKDLNGLEYFTNLTILYLNNNNLTKINLNGKDDVSSLYRSSGIIAPKGLTKLETLEIEGNSLTQLDLRGLTALKSGTLRATSNTALSCVLVDDVASSISNVNWGIDAGAKYSTNCKTTAVSDVPNGNMSVTLNPNPNTGDFTVILPYSADVSVVNPQGVTLYNTSTEAGSHNIRLSNLEQGVYFLTIKSGSNVKTEKFIINK